MEVSQQRASQSLTMVKGLPYRKLLYKYWYSSDRNQAHSLYDGVIPLSYGKKVAVICGNTVLSAVTLGKNSTITMTTGISMNITVSETAKLSQYGWQHQYCNELGRGQPWAGPQERGRVF